MGFEEWRWICELCQRPKSVFPADEKGPFSEIMLCDFTRGVEIISFLNIQPDEDKWLHSASPNPEPELSLGDGTSYTLQ